MGLKVAFVSSEVVPFAKTGGLADVSGALPVALNSLGTDVAIFMPFYREVDSGKHKIKPTGITISVPVGARVIEAEIFETSIGKVPVYLLQCDLFFDRDGLYGTPTDAYFDNLERFIFLSRGVLEALKVLDFKPDIIHCNDWQTGLIPAYLKDLYKDDEFFSSTATLFTIHNMAYQGKFPAEHFKDTCLSEELSGLEGLEFWGSINLLKSGIVFSEIITTVSETYCVEIQTEKFGCGLYGVLKTRKKDLYGVLNGVDYEVWDPAIDTLIPANYSADNPKCKVFSKRAIAEEFGLDLEPGRPLVGIISRFAVQKGFDLIKEAVPELMKMDFALVVLGSGESVYEEFFTSLAKDYPKRVGLRIGYDNNLAHLIEAGSDIFLMPSDYEPCGLNQMYSLRYGTIPLVSATGGLNDTITDYAGGKGNGFKFTDKNAKGLVEKLKEALDLYSDSSAWGKLMRSGMREDFSWSASAAKYVKLYEQALDNLLKK